MGVRKQQFGWRRSAMLAAGLAVAGVTSAKAATITVDFNAESGYSAGALAGQPSGGSPVWVDSANAFAIGANGTGGSQALQPGAVFASGNTASYKPAAVDYGVAFDASSSQLAYSFNIKELNAGQSSAHIVRVYLGSLNNGSGSAAYLQFSANASGSTLSIKPNAGNEQSTAGALSNASQAFHAISGVIDYGLKTFTVNVDGVPANTGTGGTSTYNFLSAATTFVDYGSIFVIERTASSPTVGSFVLDDFKLTASVPEPASMAVLAVGVALAGRRRRTN